MRPRGTPAELEARRRRAIELLKEGRSLNEVARRLGCGASSVMRWRNEFKAKGPVALASRPVPGRPPKLTTGQKKELVRLIEKGPWAAGYESDQWSTSKIADLIRKRFGVEYHRDHIGRLLTGLGFQFVRSGEGAGRKAGWFEVGHCETTPNKGKPPIGNA
jgi:transposase